MYDRRARYIINHDGDTVTLLLDQGFYDMKQLNLRLANVWAPETDEFGGAEVTIFVQEWFNRRIIRDIHTTWPFIVHVAQQKKAEHDQMSFNRYIATVMSYDGKESLNSDVMKFIVDRGYTGGIGSIARPAAPLSRH